MGNPQGEGVEGVLPGTLGRTIIGTRVLRMSTETEGWEDNLGTGSGVRCHVHVGIDNVDKEG